MFDKIKMFNLQHRVSFLLIMSALFLGINSFSLNRLSIIGYMALVALIISWLFEAYYYLTDRLYEN